ncbi:hypothetical protein [Janibacter sp. HTCC2649]|uniref:hypothetical protein n=1 Tax=Janibacter sp. HTCC2649 TaxID=313589 RepID=UPI0011D2487E|nr:hypothetical protein [Janibacter sp. HTCC2649]
MRRTAGTGRSLRSGLAAVGCAALLMATSGCSQPEPDEQRVAAAVGKLSGVVAVDASFTGTSLGGAGDQSLEVEVASPPDAQQVEDLVRLLPTSLRGIKNADGYDEFVITVRPAEGAEAATVGASLAFGPELTPPGLATRWANAVATSSTGGLRVQVWPAPRTPRASISTHEPVGESLTWALTTELTDLDWDIAEYQTPGTPYVRFAPGRPLTASMVADWKAIETTYAGDTGAASIARVVVVEDVADVRKVRVQVSFPAVSGPLTETAHGAAIWPIVEAINDAMPAGHRLDLELGRSERGEQNGGSGDGDLVDGGSGSADWEAAYRQRFPDAVPVSTTPG